MRRVVCVVAVLFVSGAFVAACGGSSSSSSSDDPSVSESPSGDGDPGGGGGGSSSGATATVTIGSDSYEFTDGSCSVSSNGSVTSQFSEGSDTLNLTYAESDGVALVRMTINGERWVDKGTASPPEVSGSDVSWTGGVSVFESGDAPQTATIEMAC